METIFTKEKAINVIIASGCDTNQISDGHHTFGELYEHRIQLFMTICRVIDDLKNILKNNPMLPPVWKSEMHYDGTKYEGWFVLGIGKEKGKQMTYHLPMSKWDECKFAESLECAPEFDGHTSEDVLKRLKEL